MTPRKIVVKKTTKKAVVKKPTPKKTKKDIANEEKFAKLVGQINSKKERGFAFVATLKDDEVEEVTVCSNKVKGAELLSLIGTLATMYDLEDELVKILLIQKIRS